MTKMVSGITDPGGWLSPGYQNSCQYYFKEDICWR